MQNDPSARPRPIVATVSREIVSLLKESFGRGPTMAKTYLHEDCLMVLLREGHTRTEAVISAGGGERSVAQTRIDISELTHTPSSRRSRETPGARWSGSSRAASRIPT